MSESALIDRLVLGLPPREVLIRQMRALVCHGWTHREIGGRYGMTPEAVSQTLSRARRASAR